MTDYIKAWQCIGCGRIEAPQTCIGVCQDRKVEFIHADEHEKVLTKAKALENFVRRLALITPRNGEWERSYLALQVEARRILGSG